MGDKLSMIIKIVSSILQALVCGSIFYNLKLDSSSIFLRPGALFFPILYFLLEGLSETTGAFMGRPILSRQKRFGFYRPTAFVIANAITDLPMVIVQISCFSLILYFMSGLQMNAARFFTFWIILIAYTLCSMQLFRAVGALCKKFGIASMISGFLSTIFFVYGGYLIPFEKMHVWFRWIFYLNPGAYGLLGEVLWDVKVKCEPSELIKFAAPTGQTCGAYMAEFITAQTGYLIDSSATECQFCQYSTGADYAKTFNLREKYYAWRDVSIFFSFNFERG